MPRFFVQNDQITEDKIVIVGEDAHHIARSLRMAVGDRLQICDMSGKEYDGKIFGFEEDISVYVEILSCREASNESPCYIRLFQALPKGDKLDTIIQKSVECGVSEIIPFESERCVVKMKAEAEERKTERREKIATEAAKQCGRSVLPKVWKTVRYADMLDMATQSDLCLFCYEGEGTVSLGKVLSEIPLSGKSVSVVIGSEGGFSMAEAETACVCGAKMVGLGKRILRTETASSFVLACLSYVTELQ